MTICVIGLSLVNLSGCFYVGKDTYLDIVQRPYTEWSERDVLTVIAEPAAHNYFDFRTNIKVCATPYYPSVILAIQRAAQRIHHWDEFEFRMNVEQLLKENTGMYYDWESQRFVDPKGNFLKSPLQFDSLMFLITLENRAWSSQNSMQRVIVTRDPSDVTGKSALTAMVPLIGFDQVYLPEISDLQERIYLCNGRGKKIKPKYVWGRRHNFLTLEETLFAMFPLRDGSRHFLDGCEEMELIVTGFETTIALKYPLEMMIPNTTTIK